jgi:aspartate/methionine/tyrosine aminotransferase
LSIEELISLSSDPETTRENLGHVFRSLKFSMGDVQGSPAARRAIAALYDRNKGTDVVTEEHVLTSAGTTEANTLVFQSLLDAGDHVICLYPTYGPLRDLPKSMRCEVSPWRLDPDKQWKLNLEELRRLIRPSTKMIILNNPNNPTGSFIDADAQTQILRLAREHNIIVLADEIFRPLFHHGPVGEVVNGKNWPPSLVEHPQEYSRVIVTGSLSKAWGMSGVRLGWVVCRDRALMDLIHDARQYTSMATSNMDEVVAAEGLSERCRPAILQRHLEYAEINLKLLEAFVDKNRDLVSWTKPAAGATAFFRFNSTSNGNDPVDDVEFCRALLKEKGVLLSPGGLCFGGEGSSDFQGYTRVHFTLPPDYMQKGLDLIDAFLATRRTPGLA